MFVHQKNENLGSQYPSVPLIPLIVALLIGVLVNAKFGLVAIMTVIVLLVTVLLVTSRSLFARCVFWLLVSKPIVDLTWRWNVGSVAGQRLNLQTLIGLYAIFLVIVVWILRRPVVSAWPVVGLVGASALSVLLSIGTAGFSNGLNDFLRLTSGISLFFVAGSVLCKEHIFRRFAWLVVVTITVPLALSLLQLWGRLPYESWDWISGMQVGRLSGSYPHVANLVCYLTYGHLLALYLFSRSNKAVQRVFLLMWMGLLYYVLYYTYHRTAYLVIALQLVSWLYLQRQGVLALLTGVAGAIGAITRLSVVKELYASSLVALSSPAAVFTQSFLRGRGEQWSRYLRDFAHFRPFYWLTGRGNALLIGDYPQYVLASDDPHNDFLRFLYTYGFLGLFFYLGTLFSLFGVALRLLKLSTRRFDKDLGRLVLLSVVSIAVMSMTTVPTRYPAAVWYLFVLGSVATSRYRQNRQANWR
ncbi:MAG: O-antigen ligase family protein [Chloroflexi bacterium]|nr:O-antigen ligase family protein [Chloroflexota bacterium]